MRNERTNIIFAIRRAGCTARVGDRMCPCFPSTETGCCSHSTIRAVAATLSRRRDTTKRTWLKRNVDTAFRCYEALVAAMLREDFISASNARDLEEELSQLQVDDRDAYMGKLLTNATRPKRHRLPRSRTRLATSTSGSMGTRLSLRQPAAVTPRLSTS